MAAILYDKTGAAFCLDHEHGGLAYGTLMEWVKVHPALAIPDDIVAMKAANDADLVEKRKAALAAELAAMEGAAA